MALPDRSACQRRHRETLDGGALRPAHAGARMRRFAAILLVILLAGCAARRPAPVVERPQQPTPPPVVEAPPPEPPVEKPVPTHVVKKGDTLVSIALQYGIDYRELAAWNNITNPNRIEIGQVLALAAPAGMPPLATPLATPLVQAGPPIEARPLAHTQMAKGDPRPTDVPVTRPPLP